MANPQVKPIRPDSKPPSEIKIFSDHAIVTLTHGLEAIIDLADADRVRGIRWKAFVNKIYGNAYAVCAIRGKTAFMHRLLMNAPSGTQVDHIDGDGLNNRRANMRLATPTQNQANRIADRRNRLGVKGVHIKRGKYKATIKPNGKSIHLGTYATKEEAAAAYRGAAKVLWGDFAR